MSMRLIGAVTSPYVRKVRVVLAEKKLDYRFVPEDVGPTTPRSPPPTRWARCPAW